MKRFEFEARKDVAQVYNFVLRQKKAQAVEYVKQHPQILRALVDGYNDPEIALNAGSILREVIRHEELNEMLLNDPQMFDAFFEYVQLSTFDVASDAFATFKVSGTHISSAMDGWGQTVNDERLELGPIFRITSRFFFFSDAAFFVFFLTCPHDSLFLFLFSS